MTSVLTSTLNSAQTLVTMDMMNKLRPDMSGRQQVMTGSIAGGCIIVIAALWAPQIAHFDSIVKYFQQLISYIAPPVVAVFIAGLFWKRATATAAFVGLLSGLGIAAGLLFGIQYTPLARWHFLYIAPLLFFLSLIIIVAASFFTRAPSKASLDRYLWKPSFYREESKDLIGIPWFKNYRVLSVLILVLTLVFIFIWR